MDKQYLQTINYVDERNRTMRVEFFLSEKLEGQCYSHGLSYLGARQMLQELGSPMGLDLLVIDFDKVIITPQ